MVVVGAGGLGGCGLIRCSGSSQGGRLGDSHVPPHISPPQPVCSSYSNPQGWHFAATTRALAYYVSHAHYAGNERIGGCK